MKAGRDVARAGLSDRERILMAIIDRLSATFTLAPACRNRGWSSDGFKDSYGSEYVHFAPWDKAKPGDLVLAKTGHVSEWKVGWYVEPLPGSYGGAVIREIGTNRLCNYGNEDFCPIRGLDSITLLEGDKRQFYAKVMTAFRKGDEYVYRFGGLTFEGNEAVIGVREVFGGALSGAGSEPFYVRLVWSKKTSVKAILAAMRAGGYGTHKFIKVEQSAAKSTAVDK